MKGGRSSWSLGQQSLQRSRCRGLPGGGRLLLLLLLGPGLLLLLLLQRLRLGLLLLHLVMLVVQVMVWGSRARLCSPGRGPAPCQSGEGARCRWMLGQKAGCQVQGPGSSAPQHLKCTRENLSATYQVPSLEAAARALKAGVASCLQRLSNGNRTPPMCLVLCSVCCGYRAEWYQNVAA